MNLQYSEIFARRGDAYHAAMQKEPSARDAEFRALFSRYPVGPGQTVLDIPAGGGYLARVLPRNVGITELELSAGFTPHLRLVDANGDWGVGSFDHAVCLAGLHHIADQDGFVSRLVRHVRPGGVVHVADVDRATALGRFLDGFVGRFNVTGHEGKYLDAASFAALPDTVLLSSEVRECPWRFANVERLLDFAADLFGLVAYPRDQLSNELHRIGIHAGSNGVVLRWQLRYVDLGVGAGVWGKPPAP
jgi:SAM-dependent methyltransferase